MNKSDAIHDAWDEALPWIVFSYNKMYIPGTTMSPFLLRNGFHPLYPEDLARHKYVCVNLLYRGRYESSLGAIVAGFPPSISTFSLV